MNIKLNYEQEIIKYRTLRREGNIIKANLVFIKLYPQLKSLIEKKLNELSVAYKHQNVQEEIEEATTYALSKICTSDKFDETRNTGVLAWLHMVAKNKFLRTIDENKRHVSTVYVGTSQQEFEMITGLTDEFLIETETKTHEMKTHEQMIETQMNLELQKLDPIYYEIFLLKHNRNKSIREISIIVGLSTKQVRIRAEKARQIVSTKTREVLSHLFDVDEVIINMRNK